MTLIPFKNQQPLNCLGCGCSFSKTSHNKVFCGTSCYEKHRLAKQNKRRRGIRVKREIKSQICPTCNKSFLLNNKNNKIYCGPNCVAKAKYRRARGLPPNGGDKLCSRCGQFFIPKNSKVQICSDNCRKANRLDTYKKCLYGSTGVQEAPPRGLYRTTPVSSVYDILCKRWQMLFNAANPELKKVMQEVERRVPLC